jgi:hypothetical protein
MSFLSVAVLIWYVRRATQGLRGCCRTAHSRTRRTALRAVVSRNPDRGGARVGKPGVTYCRLRQRLLARLVASRIHGGVVAARHTHLGNLAGELNRVRGYRGTEYAHDDQLLSRVGGVVFASRLVFCDAFGGLRWWGSARRSGPTFCRAYKSFLRLSRLSSFVTPTRAHHVASKLMHAVVDESHRRRLCVKHFIGEYSRPPFLSLYDDQTTITSESMTVKSKKFQAQQADCDLLSLCIAFTLKYIC